MTKQMLESIKKLKIELDDLENKIKKYESPRQVIGGDRVVYVPQHIRLHLGLSEKDTIYFLVNQETGKVELFTESQFDDLLGDDKKCELCKDSCLVPDNEYGEIACPECNNNSQ